jgi:hypothetical protein
MKTIFRYFIEDNGQGADTAYEFGSFFDEEDGECLATEAAEDYHSDHDGWESSWPIEITILKEDGTLVGKYSVDRDVAPVFSSRKVG